MKRTALILAGAAAFDLGVMAVAAQAQQAGTPPVRIPTTSTGPTFPGPGDGAAVRDPGGPGGNGGCIPRPNIPGGGSCEPSAQSGTFHGMKMANTVFIRIDRVNTVRACATRGGEVVPHEGVQQCLIPGPEAPAIGNPLRNPPIPPR